MSRTPRRALAAAAAAAHTTAGVLLLQRMRRELLTRGRLTPGTVTWMYATYGAHTAASTWLLHRDATIATPPRLTGPLQWIGTLSALAGAGLSLAGASRFVGPGQLSGTHVGHRVGDGAYRYSRNPQYTGLILLLTGLALARRSPGVAALAVEAAAAYRWWVPVEEAHLEATFGAEYRQYVARTPRWLGRARPADSPCVA